MKQYSLSQVAKAADNMQKYGGSFAKAIGVAMTRADADNLVKLKEAFPDLIEQYKDFDLEPTVLKLKKYERSTYKGEIIRAMALLGDQIRIITLSYSKNYHLSNEYLENPDADYIICGLQDKEGINVSKY